MIIGPGVSAPGLFCLRLSIKLISKFTKFNGVNFHTGAVAEGRNERENFYSTFISGYLT
jgi:hypothetical protein